MALRKLVFEGDPMLKKMCRPVTKFDGRLHQLLDDLKETMVDENGLGLAAPQVGVLRRVFVALDERTLPRNPTAEEFSAYKPVFLEFVNPEIVETEGCVKKYEGCLSFPGEYGAVERPQRVVLQAQNRNGETFTFEATDMLARCLCHETDHLNGVTFDELAEYFYDPEVPHPLDSEITGGAKDAVEDDSAEEA